MNQKLKEKIFEQLKIDEGVVNKIYADHLGYLTFGIGHLITENDPEYNMPVGTEVSEERVKECFEHDVILAMYDCQAVFTIKHWEDFPDEVKEICINMMFNLGRTRFSKFKKTIKHLKEHNFTSAADEAQDSLWYTQVGKRAERLCNRLRCID